MNRRQAEILEDIGERVLFGLQVVAVLLVTGICLEMLW